MGKNIWLWNHYAIRMCEDQAGRHYWFSEHLIKRGHRATVFCANTYHSKRDVIDTGANKYVIKKANNTPFVFVKTTPGIGNGMDRIKNMILFYRNIFPVAKAYAKEHGYPDVIVASSVHPLTMVAGIKLAKYFGIPCICEVRDLWPEAIFAFGKAKSDSLLGKLLVAGEHWIYRHADAIVFTKEGDTDYLKEKKWDSASGGDIDIRKCHYINNGLDINAYRRSIDENIIEDEDLDNGYFSVIYAGALRPVNNVGSILDAAALVKQHSDIRFLIYGTGEQIDMLRQRVVNEKLTNVKIKGYVERKYIPYILSKSSLNILNYSQSQYNWARGNSSNKLFEYMASGKPIISTVKMGYCILQKYRCGISLQQSTPNELAKAILDIYNMPKEQHEQMGTNGREGVKDFDFHVLTDKLVNIIENICLR